MSQAAVVLERATAERQQQQPHQHPHPVGHADDPHYYEIDLPTQS